MYDHNSQFHPEIFKKAYVKLSPYLSLDDSKVDEAKAAEKLDLLEELFRLGLSRLPGICDSDRGSMD